jgi:hypothetical protein
MVFQQQNSMASYTIKIPSVKQNSNNVMCSQVEAKVGVYNSGLANWLRYLENIIS